MSSALVLYSGGLDSTTLLYLMVAMLGTDNVSALSWNYGQRHVKELEAAAKISAFLGVQHDIIDISSLGLLLTGSALTDSTVDVPEGHYSSDSMRITVVPNRNAIMLTQAFGVAISRKASFVCTAPHFGDAAIYPDCRIEFARAFQGMQDLATEGFGTPVLYTPFVSLSKTDIARLGAKLGVPFKDTWSCYLGRDRHDGRCGTCVERKISFRDAGIPDPTQYDDPLYGLDMK